MRWWCHTTEARSKTEQASRSTKNHRSTTENKYMTWHNALNILTHCWQVLEPFDAHSCHMCTAIKHPVPDRVKPSFVIFGHPGNLTLRAERQSAQVSKITNDGLTRSGTGCFIAVPSWQQWSSKGYTSTTPARAKRHHNPRNIQRKQTSAVTGMANCPDCRVNVV